MSLTKCPPIILSSITSFLDNKEGINLILTCKYIKTHGYKYGFLTTIQLKHTNDFFTFLQNFETHKKTIKTIKVHGIDNPHMWLPEYTQCLIFEHCSLSEYFNPKKQIYTTKVLKLIDYHRYKNKINLQINWNCFPNLEELYLYVYQVNINGLDDLKHLKIIKINSLI